MVNVMDSPISSTIILALLLLFLWAVYQCLQVVAVAVWRALFGNQTTQRLLPQSGSLVRSREEVPVAFIQNVIDKFNGQRQVGDQFAVVVLSRERELRHIGRTKFQPCDNSNNPLVDRRHTLYPPQCQYKNYIVGRPDRVWSYIRLWYKSVHAEEIILSQFDSLLSAYRRAEECDPTYIILYSWMMPCSDCTSAIIALSNSHLNLQTVVVYTIDWKEISREENETNRARLRAAGIIVQRVGYDRRLPYS